MSALCQKQTFCAAAETGALFDHLVSALLELHRYVEPEGSGGIEVDH